ncbi:hypothetical protein RKD44_005229 [Streptomyces collinus]
MPQHDHKACRLCSLQRHPARAQEAAVVRRLLVRQAPADRRAQGGKA